MGVTDDVIKANKARLLANYHRLAAQPDMGQFEALVEPLLRLSSAKAPCPIPDQQPQRPQVRERHLIAALARLGGEDQNVEWSELLPWGPPRMVEALIA